MPGRPRLRRLFSGDAALLCLALAACSTSPQVPLQADLSLPEVVLEGAEPLVGRRIAESMKGVRDRPEDAGAWGLLGMDLEAHSYFQQAVACYRTAARLDPLDYRWPYLTALNLARNDPGASVEWFRRTMDLDPPNPAVAVHHGSVLLATGDLEGAEARFRVAARSEEVLPWALHGQARIARRRGEHQGALALLDRAVEAAPSLGAVHAMRSEILTELGRRREAALAALAAEAHPGPGEIPDPVAAEVAARGVSAQAWVRQGHRLEEEGDLAGAEAAFRKVLSIRPPGARDHANLAGVLAMQDRLDEAIQEYLKALEVDPGSAFAHNNLAMVHLAAGDPAKAIEHLEEAIRLEPSFADAHYNLGIIKARQGEPSLAEGHLRRALELEPAHRGALNSLGTALVSSGKVEEGLAVWRRAARIDPLNTDARYNLAVALSRRGEHRRAVGHLDAALRHAPDAWPLLRLLAWELATAPEESLRDGARAVDLATRVYGQRPDDPQVCDVLAAALAEDGQMARAVSMAEKALLAAESAQRTKLSGRIRARLERYRTGRPFRQPSSESPG